MKINIKIEGLGINPVSFVEYFKNNGIKQPAVYIDNGPINNMNGITFDPLNIIGRIESIDGFVAEITFIDTMLGRSVVKIINNNPDAFYITPRVLCDKDGNIKNFISFNLHEYDDCVKCKEDKHMNTLTYWRNNSTGEIVGVFNMTDEWIEFVGVDLFGTHSLPKNDFLMQYKEVPKMPHVTEGSTWVKKSNMFHRVKVIEVGPGSMIKYRYISGFPDNAKEHIGLLVENNFKTTFMEYNDKYNENLVGSIWKFRDDEISRDVGSFIKVASVNNDQIKWVSINHIKKHNKDTVFSKGAFHLSLLSKYCEKVADNDIGAKYRLVTNNNSTVEVKSAYPSFNSDNGDVSGFVQYVDDLLSLRYELSIDEFHMKYDLISLPEKHTENNESDKVSPKAPETKTEPKTTEEPVSTYLKTDKSKLETFSTGAKREDKSGKGRYDLIPGDIMNDVEDLAWETYFQNGVTTCSATDVSKSAYFEDWTNIELYYDFVINMISYFFIPVENRVECIDDCGEISYEISWDSFRSGIYEMRKQLALHYEAGAIVHGVDNWKKGIPIYGSDKGGCFLDSMRRHTDQALQDKTDEPHAVAAIWNAFGAAWTLRHRPYSAIYQNASDVKAEEFNTNLLHNKQTTDDIMKSLKSVNKASDKIADAPTVSYSVLAANVNNCIELLSKMFVDNGSIDLKCKTHEAYINLYTICVLLKPVLRWFNDNDKGRVCIENLISGIYDLINTNIPSVRRIFTDTKVEWVEGYDEIYAVCLGKPDKCSILSMVDLCCRTGAMLMNDDHFRGRALSNGILFELKEHLSKLIKE